jgi:ankyrin repeat protein
VNQAADYEGRTPAHSAADQGHAATLEVLIKAACDVNKAANDGRTPAHFAAQNGHNNAVLEVLVRAGCALNRVAKNGSDAGFHRGSKWP